VMRPGVPTLFREDGLLWVLEGERLLGYSEVLGDSRYFRAMKGKWNGKNDSKVKEDEFGWCGMKFARLM